LGDGEEQPGFRRNDQLGLTSLAGAEHGSNQSIRRDLPDIDPGARPSGPIGNIFESFEWIEPVAFPLNGAGTNEQHVQTLGTEFQA
jgi:hypothetical protein